MSRPAAPVWTRPLAEAAGAVQSAWEAAPLRSPLQHPALVRAAAEAFGLDAVVLCAGAASRPEAVVVAFEKTLGPVRALVLPPHLPTSAPLVAGPLEPAAVHGRQTPLDALVGALNGRYAQATFRLPVGWPDARPFLWAGWRASVDYTFLAALDPADPTETWSRRTRRTARAEADAWRVLSGPGQIPLVARFQIQSLDANGVEAPATDRQLAALLAALDGAGLLRCYAVADAAFAVDGEHALFWIAGSDPGPAMTALLAHAYADLADNGVRLLDLGGAGLPSIAEFKRRVGGTLTPQLRVRHVGPRLLRVLDALRS